MYPILFTLPSGQHVYAYGVMLGVALLLGFQLTARRCRDVERVGADLGGNAFLIGAILGIIGARLLYVMCNLREMMESGAAWWDVQSGGLIGAGGLLLGGGAAVLYLRLKKAAVVEFLDASTPALSLYLVLGRLGSYLYGSDFGVQLSQSAPGWLKVLGTFPRWQVDDLLGPPVFVYHMERYFIKRDASASLPVQPVQLYEMLLGLVLLALSLRWLRQKLKSGMVFVRVGLVLAAGRYLLDYLHEDPDRGLIVGFSVTQLACLVAFPFLLLGYQHLRRTPVPLKASS